MEYIWVHKHRPFKYLKEVLRIRTTFHYKSLSYDILNLRVDSATSEINYGAYKMNRYIIIGKRIIIHVLCHPNEYAMTIARVKRPNHLNLNIECINTQIFKELFPKLHECNRYDRKH